MAGLNKVTLIGHLGKDPEMRYTQSQTPFTKFSLATTEEYKDANGERQKKTQWHNIVVWGKQAEIAQKYLHKGKQIYLEGKIEYREYDDQNGQRRYITDIRCERFLMLGAGGQGAGQGSGGGYGGGNQYGGGGNQYGGGQGQSRAADSHGGPSSSYNEPVSYEVPESDSFNDDDIPF